MVVDNVASLVCFHRFCFLVPQDLLAIIFTLEFNLKDRLPVDVDDIRNIYFLPTFRKEKENSKAGARYCLSMRQRFQGGKRLTTLISSALLLHRVVILKHFSQIILLQEIHSF